MFRIDIQERDNWQQLAKEVGFQFHTIDGEKYWDESACYRFTMDQIENHIEDPTAELEEMCFQVVDRVVEDESLLKKLAIPEFYWDYVRGSWMNREKNLYGRMDFSYDGSGPAKLLEYNADTPTSLYESAAFQWVWMEQAMEQGLIPPDCDQYNSIHEQMIGAFANMDIHGTLHMAACQGSLEDEGTVLYMEECATQAHVNTHFIHMEEIGIDAQGRLTDLQDNVITDMFKLYPWEWMMRDEFGEAMPKSGVTFIEPSWKSILSNKGILPLLWEMFEGHPNLLPSYFMEDANKLSGGYVKKPIYSREGAGVTMVNEGQIVAEVPGPYGEEGHIVQALHPLPVFEGNHTVIGSWLVASQPCGLGIREDSSAITKDTSRFVPHVIRD
ncbi:glutathionylspermidine synthase family protein [Terasakiella sp. A23]|uniref:glutathionylspermidine synthase family protein n=1 Tax=Terasakiella sp. FCG-A23 TaxID=3080561 RepID=UPI0029539BFA|nr:glutathionylspermidine synthase family protein [Terasakiella sp. A23]MDV7338144.1 glutathionylspermidine synthase family protein [Terasakiella sp. A23]